MKYWYDTEFLDNGRTVDLISIAIVSEDGREYYAHVNELDATVRGDHGFGSTGVGAAA